MPRKMTYKEYLEEEIKGEVNKARNDVVLLSCLAECLDIDVLTEKEFNEQV